MHKQISHIADTFLTGMTMTVHPAEGEDIVLVPAVEDREDTVVWTAEGNGARVQITACRKGDSVLFSTDLVSAFPLAARGLGIKLSLDWADEVLESQHYGHYWMMCGWPKTAAEIKPKTQNFLMHAGALHWSIVPLTGDIFRCEADADGLHLDAGCGGFRAFHGPFLTVSVSDDPILAVENNYRFARAEGAIRVPLRTERQYPAILEKFGWCTWDAFYKEVTSEKIYTKLTEFREKGIPVHWLIIDAGWSVFQDRLIYDFPADPAKFPEGMKECVRRIKEEFGVEQVGVWHTFNAYWDGVAPDSPLAEKYADCLMKTASGLLVPSDDPDKAFRFWDDWHGWMADCGVDFVKVDNQSFSHVYLENTVSTTAGARHAHEAIERSIAKHFGGVVIDCMGMDMENVLARPYSAVSRNSDDFYPQKENGFAQHIQQNLYSALWHSQIHHCDYDMWWSGNAAPVQSGVLRAVSGGPVYVSDKIGESDLAGILPVCGSDGDICRLDHAALPTLDCLYHNCEPEGRLLKTYNHKDDAIALAVFNISRRDITETFSFDVIPGMPKEQAYMAYEYFTKTWTKVTAGTSVTLETGADDVRCWSLYPIREDETGAYILCGDTGRYTGIGCRDKVRVTADALL